MISILSNINLEPVQNKVKKTITCTKTIGYGNVVETLMNPQSEINQNVIDAVFIIMDIRELISGAVDFEDKINAFFDHIERTIKSGVWYFISDADFYMPATFDYKGENKEELAVRAYNRKLRTLCEKKENVGIFPYHSLVRKMGEVNFYSMKAWYLGSVRHSLEGVKAISEEIMTIVKRFNQPTKKLIVVDLDNTLWKGVAGEDGIEGIILSDNKLGKAYKDFQEILKAIKESGILLSISSKNNEQDVLSILDGHPHMVLRTEDFISKRINWNLKSQSIQEIAKELNIGLDSVVFIDDNPAERAEVMAVLPMVVCPEMPTAPEKLVEFAETLLETYFKRIAITREDLEKSQQYEAKRKIDVLEKQTDSFEDFLESLEIKVVRKDARANKERLVQLLQKTNQFNTTVKRYSYQQIEEMLESTDWEFFFFEVSDKFTNHGLCVLAVVQLVDQIAQIDNFIMSCRVMGRDIEYTVLTMIEDELKKLQIKEMKATYLYGPKNMPVECLYEKAKFELVESSETKKCYLRRLNIV